MIDDELRKRIAFLETKIDWLESEISHLHENLQRFGFSKGIEDLKDSIDDILS